MINLIILEAEIYYKFMATLGEILIAKILKQWLKQAQNMHFALYVHNDKLHI